MNVYFVLQYLQPEEGKNYKGKKVSKKSAGNRRYNNLSIHLKKVQNYL